MSEGMASWKSYEEWLACVPEEITGDSLWRMDVYRLALFVGDIGGFRSREVNIVIIF